MIQSMTGYGRETVHIGENIITIEVRSINHRFLDISIKAPRSLLFLEDKMNKVIRKFFNRGRIEVYFHFTGNFFVQKDLQIEWSLADQLYTNYKVMKSKYSLQEDLTLSDFLMIPELIQIEELEDYSDEMIDQLMICLKKACEHVSRARKSEAVQLMKDIKERIEKIKKAIQTIEQKKDVVNVAYQKRIEERMDKFLKKEIVDEARLHQEIAFLIERGDISEEITRIQSHINHFEKTLGK